LAVTICSSNLDERQPGLAHRRGQHDRQWSYMIVNELALSPGGFGVKRHFPPT
jgi:hypothetical protein